MALGKSTFSSIHNQYSEESRTWDSIAEFNATNLSENWLFQFFNQDSYLTFDGTDDFVDCGAVDANSAISLGSSTGATVAFWVKFTTAGAFEWIFHNDVVSDNDYAGLFVYKDDNEKMNFAWGNNTGGGSDHRESMVGNQSIALNTWYFVAIATDFALTESSGVVTGTSIYTASESAGSVTINAVTNAGDAGVSTPTYTSGRAYFGRRGDTESTHFGEFQIKRFGIWNEKLTSTEVTALYNSGNYLSFMEDSGNYASSANLISYWEFNNGDPIVRDLQGNFSGLVTGANYGGFLPLALNNTTCESVFYNGAITSQNPTLRESIDLTTSKAASNNLSIDIANYQYQGDSLSAELLLGSNTYLNRGVRIFSQINDDTDLDNCIQIFHGRLTDINHNIENVNVTLSSMRPWDKISIPQDKSSNNVYTPIAYGDYDANNATTETKKNKVFPLPVVKATGGKIYFAMHKAISDSSLLINYYDSSSDLFPVLTADSNTSSKYDINTVGVDVNITRRFRIYGDSASIDINSDWSNHTNVLAPSGDATISNETNTAYDYVDIAMPDFSGALSDLKVFVKGSLSPDASNTAQLSAKVYGTDVTALSHGSPSLQATSGSTDIDSSGSEYSVANFNSFLDNQDAVPGTISVGAKTASGTYDAVVTNVYMTATSGVAIDEPDSAGRERKDLKYVYCGADGLTASWDGDAITHGHDAHRDLLIRFAGHDNNDPDGWSALNVDRAKDNWRIRYWLLEQAPLKTILEKIQYEFGFIAKYSPSGKLKYIYPLQQSELSADHTLTKEDTSNLRIKNTSLSDIVTEMNISTEKHAGETSRYMTVVNAKNTTARNKYHFHSQENIKDIKLDMNIGTIPTTPNTDINRDFFSYYTGILGDVKKIVSCEVVNPAKGFKMETGDIVSYSDMGVDPGGESWSNQYFMIINLQRSPGKVSIVTREVG